jgi:hypothetical protein
MKTFLKQNWFKILIGFIIIVAIASAGIFLFKKDKLSSFSASILKSFKDDKENEQSFQQQELEKTRLELEMMKLEVEQQKLQTPTSTATPTPAMPTPATPAPATPKLSTKPVQTQTDSLEQQRLDIEKQQLLMQQQEAARIAENKSLLNTCLTNTQQKYEDCFAAMEGSKTACLNFAAGSIAVAGTCLTQSEKWADTCRRVLQDTKNDCYQKYPQ